MLGKVGKVQRFRGRGDAPERLYRHYRPNLHKILLVQLEKVGLQVEYGHHIISYFEDGDLEKGVIPDNGEKIEADLVVAADGVDTKITHFGSREESSG